VDVGGGFKFGWSVFLVHRADCRRGVLRYLGGPAGR